MCMVHRDRQPLGDFGNFFPAEVDFFNGEDLVCFSGVSVIDGDLTTFLF